MRIVLTHNEVMGLAAEACGRIVDGLSCPAFVYPIPRGGVPVAYALAAMDNRIVVVEKPEDADFYVDDLIGSGATMRRTIEQHGEKPFIPLLDKRTDERFKGKWIVFPWEDSAEAGVEDHITRILEFVGDDPLREGLLETPRRVAKAWAHWCSGYGKQAKDVLKVFEDGADNYDQMVLVKDIPIYSKCEHHLADIFGTATIAYIPNGKIVGLSKLSRLADMFARRLQVQERLTSQIADAMVEHLQPIGVGVMIRARHMCMESRGICQQGHYTVTTALRGAIKDEPQTRSEFLRLAGE